jgi:5'-nucleotidase
MRILIVNDDGMQAAQLPNLVRWARKFGDVTVFVPKFEQSGKSHSFEIRRDIEVKQVPIAEDVTVWSVDSTPADCVRIAVLAMKLKFDLCISGVNRGFNMGADIMYSGTCAAAYEAVNLGIPAIALSTSFENYPNATEELDRVWEFIHSRKLLSVNNLYNVNIPPQPRGFRITRQGGPFYSDDFPHVGNHMYRPTGKPIWQDSQDDTLDTDATLHGYITITPLQLDRTNREVFRKLQELPV